MAACFTQLKS